jgi:hypothetical protein
LETRCETLIPIVLQTASDSPRRARPPSTSAENRTDSKLTAESKAITMLSIDQLKQGMELARDVVGPNGEVLLTEGTQLTLQQLSNLRGGDIGSVAVASKPPPETLIAPHLLEIAEASVNDRFRHVPSSSPTVEIIKQHAVMRTAARLEQQPKVQ